MATFVVKLTYDGFFYSPTSRIRMEWGDTLTEISDPVAAGDSVLFKHAWLKSGTYQVTAVALAYPSRDHLHGQSGFHHRAIPSLTRRSSTPSGGRLSLSRSRITRAGRA